MNKYKTQSRHAQRLRKKARQCDQKRRYATPEEAQQKGQQVYQCPQCNGWHRSGQLGSMIAELRRSTKKSSRFKKTGNPEKGCL